MNLSRTAVILLGVLVVLLGVSAYLWSFYGTGQAEADPRIAGALQNFTCDKCGYTFTMTMAEVSHMRRTRGMICCPKCGEGGAHKDLLNRAPSTQPASATTTPLQDQRPAEGPEAVVAPAADREPTQPPEAAPEPAGRPDLAGEDNSSVSSP
jgi:hypothetical protein